MSSSPSMSSSSGGPRRSDRTGPPRTTAEKGLPVRCKAGVGQRGEGASPRDKDVAVRGTAAWQGRARGRSPMVWQGRMRAGWGATEARNGAGGGCRAAAPQFATLPTRGWGRWSWLHVRSREPSLVGSRPASSGWPGEGRGAATWAAVGMGRWRASGEWEIEANGRRGIGRRGK